MTMVFVLYLHFLYILVSFRRVKIAEMVKIIRFPTWEGKESKYFLIILNVHFLIFFRPPIPYDG